MNAPQGEPILIDCEGAGCPPARVYVPEPDYGGNGVGMCAMCGQPRSVIGGMVLWHQRDDIVARVKRGDFG